MNFIKTGLYAFEKLKVVLLPSALVLFTLYAFFQPSLSPDLHPLSIIIFVFCLLYLLVTRPAIKISRPLYWIFAYFILGGFSVFIPTTNLASKEMWMRAALSVTADLVIWLAYREAQYSARKVLKKIIGFTYVLLALLILLQNISGGHFSPRKLELLQWMTPVLNHWMQKYQELWLLLFMWIAVACFSKFRKRFVFIFLTILLCGVSLFSGYSPGSQIAFIASVLFYAFGIMVKKLPKNLLIFCVIGVVILVPLFSITMNLSSVTSDKCLPILKNFNNNHLTPRLVIWNYATHIVSINPITGFGFGSSFNLPGKLKRSIVFYQPEEFIGKLASSSPILLYPGKHPHSTVFLVLIDLGLIGLLLYLGFLKSIIAEIAHSRVPYWSANAAGSLLLTCVIYWQLSFSFWDFECLLLLFMSAGLMSLMLNTSHMGNYTAQIKAPVRSIERIIIPIILATGIIFIVMNYPKEKKAFNKLEKANISLSDDSSKIIINGNKHPISYTPGGYYNLLILNNKPSIRLNGWAADPLEKNKVVAVIFIHKGNKISILKPRQASFAARKKYNKNKLLFTGFSLTVNIPYSEINNYQQFMAIALFQNGEARRLYKVQTINMASQTSYRLENDSTISFNGKDIPIIPNEVDGWVKAITVAGNKYYLNGWAADVKNSRLVDEILVFVDNKLGWSAKTLDGRPDIGKTFNKDHLAKVDYSTFFTSSRVNHNSNIRIIAVSNERASELSYKEKGEYFRKLSDLNDKQKTTENESRLSLKKMASVFKVLLISEKPALSIEENMITSTDGKKILLVEKAFEGWVDTAEDNGEHINLSGWAANMNNLKLVDSIVVFVDGKESGRVKTDVLRVDVSKALNSNNLKLSGYQLSIPKEKLKPNSNVRIIAISGNTASELNYNEKVVTFLKLM